ncbi:apolipoprotein N-acyltransferase [Paucibacter sediminis]|uniref:Apolipoprotein N-acyltransferase n=1 Tax=Paucibacter sediminis TaxID=3019553 RepID=A0AA95SNM4_9BURK|nr:apolipoprotein N-acyltransferase [Paucibacter sp. S2-9]WIT12712.1 apolipoprotein N-acyltransferase [Paucibacter sp. S2-9]
MRRLLQSWPVALLAGLLHLAAFAPTQAWVLQPLALAWLAWASWDATPARAARLGLAFGLAWLAGGLWWLYISMHEFGHLPGLMAGGAVLLLAAFLSLYLAGAMALAAWLRGTSVSAWHGLTWALCWLLAELARATLFGGFPWIASGYAHTVGPLAAWAPWLGVYGITLLAALLAAALAAALRGARLALAPALLILLAGLLLPQDFTRSSGSIKLSLLQPNVPQDQKFDRELMDANLQRLYAQIAAARGQVVLTPESVVPLPLAYLPPEFLQALAQGARERPLLLGSFLGDEQTGFVNSLQAFGGDARGQQAYSYGKRHLLPFGEYIPPGFHWFVRMLQIPMDDQAAGQHQQAFAVAGQRLRPLICYEDLFGEDFVQSVVGADAATVLVNASNLAWFGTLMVQDQHLQFSVMRTLEFQRPLVRSTNTGATAALDHRGRVLARLPAATAGVLEVEVEGRTGSTPYARWLAALGLWPFGALLVLGLGWAWRRRR